MAEENNNAPQGEAKRSPLVWIIVAIVAVVIIAGVAGFMWYSQQQASSPADEAAADASQLIKPKAKPAFIPLDKFVVGLDDGSGQRYLMLELAIVTPEHKAVNKLHDLAPVLRNTLLKHFANRSYRDVKKEVGDLPALQQVLKKQLAQAVDDYGYHVAINKLLITNMVIQ